METNHNQIVSLIWNIADDVLRDVFLRGQYRDVILPMVVLRRLDALLEPTKEEVNKMKSLDQQPQGSRIASIHNGSCLFTGDAGSGESNIRQLDVESQGFIQSLFENL